MWCYKCGTQVSQEDAFCPQCGVQVRCAVCSEELDPEAAFCGSCGAAVLPVAECAEEAAGTDGVSVHGDTEVLLEPHLQDAGSAFAAQNPLDSESTRVIPVVLPSGEGGLAREGRSDSRSGEGSSLNKKRLVVIIVAAVFLVAACFGAVWFFALDRHQAPEADGASEIEVVDDQEGEGENADKEQPVEERKPLADSASASDAKDDSLYQKLLNAYDQAGDFDAKVKAIASRYTDTIYSSSSSGRSAVRSDASKVRSDISDAQKTIAGLSVPSTSKYYQNWTDIQKLYDDLYQRVDVMHEALNVALSYGNPKAHSAEIDGIIVAQNDSDGINKYKKDFDALYPQAKPEK